MSEYFDINGTIKTDDYKEHKQLFIDAIKELRQLPQTKVGGL